MNLLVTQTIYFVIPAMVLSSSPFVQKPYRQPLLQLERKLGSSFSIKLISLRGLIDNVNPEGLYLVPENGLAALAALEIDLPRIINVPSNIFAVDVQVDIVQKIFVAISQKQI